MMDSYDNNNYIIIVVFHSFIRIVYVVCIYDIVLHTPHTCTRHSYSTRGKPEAVYGLLRSA